MPSIRQPSAAYPQLYYSTLYTALPIPHRNHAPRLPAADGNTQVRGARDGPAPCLPPLP